MPPQQEPLKQPTQPTPTTPSFDTQIPPAFSVPAPSNNRNKGPIILWSIIILVILVGGVFAYKKYFHFSDGSDKTLEPPQEIKSDSQIAVEPKSHVIATVPDGLVIPGSIWGPTQIGFSNNGKEVVYPAIDKNTKKNILMKNNISLGELMLYDISPGTPDTMSSSLDGERVNYMAIKINGDYVSPKDIKSEDVSLIINDVEQKYKSLEEPYPYTGVEFSSNGKDYVYSLWNRKDKKAQIIFNNEEIFVANIPQSVINGKIISGFSAIDTTLSLDGRRVGVISQNGLKQEAVIIDTQSKVVKKDKAFDRILSDVIFNPDGSHYLYRARDGQEEFMVLDGVAQKNFGISGTAWPPVLSHDSKKVAYTTKRVPGDDKSVVEAMDLSTGAIIPYIPADFPMSVYIATTDSSDIFNDPDFNINSATVYDNSKKNKFVVAMDMSRSDDAVLNAEMSKVDPNDIVKMSEIMDKTMLFSVEINGRKLDKLFQFVSAPQFSEDGKHLSFGVRYGRELKWLVYDLVSGQFVQ